MIKYEEKILKQRIEYLLYDSRYSKRSRLISDFINPLLEVCHVGLFGGAVRDMLFKSSRDFDSDLDFVVEVKNEKKFLELIKKWAPEENSYGGYKTVIGNTKIDFWQLKDTWVKKNSSLTIDHIEDLVRTTFFNIDAIIYDLNNRKIYKGAAFRSGVENKFLDINYADNPNLDSVAVKALRRLWTHDLSASNTLISFIIDRIEKSGWDTLVERDSVAYPHHQILTQMSAVCSFDKSEFSSLLVSSKHLNKSKQMSLPL